MKQPWEHQKPAPTPAAEGLQCLRGAEGATAAMRHSGLQLSRLPALSLSKAGRCRSSSAPLCTLQHFLRAVLLSDSLRKQS